jgi:hypothetical protein
MLDFSDKHPAPAVPEPTLAPAQANANESRSAEPPAADVSLCAPGSRWRHYRGGIYEIQGLCVMEATGAPGVLYRSADPLERAVHARELAEFLAPAGSAAQPRFARLHEPSRAALRKALPVALLGDCELDAVLARHTTSGRYYHDHRLVLRNFERAAEAGLALSAELSAALLFQHAVYVAGVPEGLRAKLCGQLLVDWAPHLKFCDAPAGARLIEEAAALRPLSRDAALLCDINQAALAEQPHEFCAADELLWLENRHLLERSRMRRDFDTRRLKFLLIRANSSVLFSPEGQRWEAAARSNIEALRQAWVAKYGGQGAGAPAAS